MDFDRRRKLAEYLKQQQLLKEQSGSAVSERDFENFDSAYGDQELPEQLEPDNKELYEQALAEKEDLRKGYLMPNKRTPKKDISPAWDKIRQMFKRQ